MAKRKRSFVEYEELEASRFDSSKEVYSDEDCEPTEEEIALAEEANIDSDSGESLDETTQEFREQAAVNPSLYYTSKDGEILYSKHPITTPRHWLPTTVPGNLFLYFRFQQFIFFYNQYFRSYSLCHQSMQKHPRFISFVLWTY